jgi:hypothetical protein
MEVKEAIGPLVGRAVMVIEERMWKSHRGVVRIDGDVMCGGARIDGRDEDGECGGRRSSYSVSHCAHDKHPHDFCSTCSHCRRIADPVALYRCQSHVSKHDVWPMDPRIAPTKRVSRISRF